MTGPLALHGGGEFLPGDEPFLRALLAAARPAAAERARGCLPAPADGGDPAAIRIVVVPVAAARERPDLALATAEEAFDRIAAGSGQTSRFDGVPIVDRESAGAARWAGLLAGADLVYLPGGDPDLAPAILPGTVALRAILAARARGAVLAGASAGAMALAAWTWTPAGGRTGLGIVPGLVVAPHFEPEGFAGWHERVAAAPGKLGLLGLSEQTGILSSGRPSDGHGQPWRVIGPGSASWYPPGAGEPIVTRDGGTLLLPD